VHPLDGLDFDNRYTASLPADPVVAPHRRQVTGAAYSRVHPTPVGDPSTLAVSPEVADLLGLDHEQRSSDDFARVFSGTRVPVGADPWAACYGGHQFGHWAGQLGDGRAIVLGEVRDRDGRHQMVQLKGAGPTPYSRTADGRAVLRSSLREFLCSEAMHHLGVPTTRALSMVVTGDQVVRDMLYDGNPRPEPGAVVCRVAPSFTRFGTFELPAARGDLALLRQLVDHALRHEAWAVTDTIDPDASFDAQVATWFDGICRRTAELVVHWMRVGFVHGVLNTDNMSSLGLTIDYGPYGWLEPFDPGWTPNTTDAGGRRYRFGAQPQVAQWNLLQLANALVALTDDPEPFEAALDHYREVYDDGFRTMMAERLGWGLPRSDDSELIGELFGLLQRTETDYVIFFRELAAVAPDPSPDADIDRLLAPLEPAWYQPEELTGDLRDAFGGWLRAWSQRAAEGGLDDDERRRRMNAVNPRYVLRNYLAQEAIDAAEQGDTTLVHQLLDVLRDPYTDQPGMERFAARRPEWARNRVGCSMLSCSS
jgi:serine/tyrosine/threonine adenylyltransferase